MKGKTISMRIAAPVLRRLGTTDPGKARELFPQDQRDADAVDFYGFCEAALYNQQLKRAAFRENGCFGPSEVNELRRIFDMYDRDKSGEISPRELNTLIEAQFPTL